ncbi:MAG: hypothetical protein ACMVY4_18950 [Minwuia sp.]|uniref:hypothetical protein n=1 Tax=Minwuia sp. TaxID=2493630 RepID=UPI003A889E45
MRICTTLRAGLLATGLTALGLTSACESDREPVARISITDVQVRRSATVAGTALPAGLRDSMMAIVPGCAGKGIPHLAMVEVLAVRRDRNDGVLRQQGVTLVAEVSFISRVSDDRSAPYRVSVSTAGTGLAGAPAGNPDSVLPNLFAAAVCRDVFGVELDLGR